MRNQQCAVTYDLSFGGEDNVADEINGMVDMGAEVQSVTKVGQVLLVIYGMESYRGE